MPWTFVCHSSLALPIFNISKTISRIFDVKLSVNIVVTCRFIGSFRNTPSHVTQYDYLSSFNPIQLSKSSIMVLKFFKHNFSLCSLHQHHLLCQTELFRNLKWMLPGKFRYFFVVCWFFFKINFFKKFIQEHHLSVEQIESRSGPNDLSGLIWVQSVCKVYEQTALVDL